MEEEGLMKIKGIGEKKAQKILAEAKNWLDLFCAPAGSATPIIRYS